MTVTHTETSALREHPDFLAPNFFFSASIKGLAAPLFVRKHVRFGNEIREKKIEGKEVIRSDEKRVGGSREGEPFQWKERGEGKRCPTKKSLFPHCLGGRPVTSKPPHSSHSSPLIGPLSFSYTLPESENLRPDRTVMVVQSNHHLVPANRQRGQECLYAHISQLGILVRPRTSSAV